LGLHVPLHTTVPTVYTHLVGLHGSGSRLRLRFTVPVVWFWLRLRYVGYVGFLGLHPTRTHFGLVHAFTGLPPHGSRLPVYCAVRFTHAFYTRLRTGLVYTRFTRFWFNTRGFEHTRVCRLPAVRYRTAFAVYRLRAHTAWFTPGCLRLRTTRYAYFAYGSAVWFCWHRGLHAFAHTLPPHTHTTHTRTMGLHWFTTTHHVLPFTPRTRFTHTLVYTHTHWFTVPTHTLVYYSLLRLRSLHTLWFAVYWFTGSVARSFYVWFTVAVHTGYLHTAVLHRTVAYTRTVHRTRTHAHTRFTVAFATTVGFGLRHGLRALHARLQFTHVTHVYRFTAHHLPTRTTRLVRFGLPLLVWFRFWFTLPTRTLPHHTHPHTLTHCTYTHTLTHPAHTHMPLTTQDS